MAYALNSNSYVDAAPSGLIARIRQALADYRVYLQTRNELDSLNDRELADLGIARGNITDIARGAAYGN